jgi:hypothetical protein
VKIRSKYLKTCCHIKNVMTFVTNATYSNTHVDWVTPKYLNMMIGFTNPYQDQHFAQECRRNPIRNPAVSVSCLTMPYSCVHQVRHIDSLHISRANVTFILPAQGNYFLVSMLDARPTALNWAQNHHLHVLCHDRYWMHLKNIHQII